VTFEDPVERWWCEAPDDCRRYAPHIDYTPRQKGIDAVSLGQVLHDALRQTPAVLFVGETRSADDWKPLFDFAGSGHLIVTTTHAGSLTECMTRLFRATGSKNPADRRDLASVLLAVIHLETCDVRDQTPTGRRQILVPTLWRSTPLGEMALIADGCASMLPSRIDDKNTSTLGRRWYVDQVSQAIRHAKLDAFLDNLKQMALKRDLIEL
jgi:Tfp pilus assembly pilus retraction ATPase PilT